MPAPPSSEFLFVTVGTTLAPFDRLIHASEDLLSLGMDIVVQRGPSRVSPQGVTVVDVLDYPSFLAHMRSAAVVVGHAGIGTTGLAVKYGRPLVVVPRLASEGEAVDDHQLHYSRVLAARGLGVAIEDMSKLADAVLTAKAPELHSRTRDYLATALRAAILEGTTRDLRHSRRLSSHPNRG